MEISNLSDAELETLDIRMLKKLSEDLSSIKKIQSEMKDTLIENKTKQNNLQRNNSRVDETRIKLIIWNTRKQKTTNQNKKKKTESKKTPKNPKPRRL